VDYKFVDINNDRREFERTVTQQGKDGWEYAGSERFLGARQGELVLVFKKHRGGAVRGGMMGFPGVGGGGGIMAPGGLGATFGGGPGGGGGGLGGSGFGGFGSLEGSPMQGFGGGGDGGGIHFRSPDTKGVEAMTQHLQHGKAADVAKAIEKALPKAKILKVDFEPTSNMIVVIADSASMKEASRIIREVESRGAPGGSSLSGGAGASSAGGPGGTRSRSSSGSGGEGGRGGVAENRGPLAGLSGMGPGGGGGFNPYGPGGPVHVVKLRNAAAPDLATVISRVFPNASITAEPRSNQLIIRADDKTKEEIEKLIGRLDVDGPAPPVDR